MVPQSAGFGSRCKLSFPYLRPKILPFLCFEIEKLNGLAHFVERHRSATPTIHTHVHAARLWLQAAVYMAVQMGDALPLSGPVP